MHTKGTENVWQSLKFFLNDTPILSMPFACRYFSRIMLQNSIYISKIVSEAIFYICLFTESVNVFWFQLCFDAQTKILHEIRRKKADFQVVICVKRGSLSDQKMSLLKMRLFGQDLFNQTFNNKSRFFCIGIFSVRATFFK